MDKENNKMKYLGKLIFKLIITGIALFVSYIVSIYLLIIFSSLKINVISTVWSALLLPTLLLILIYSKNKKRNLKRFGIFILVFFIVLGINIGINKYEESITVKTNVNIDCNEYLPFTEDSKIVKLDKEASLKLTEKLPILDGAAAVFPVYSAFVNATYPSTVELHDGIFEYNNTVGGYRRLAEKETDIFFGAYPSEEQIDFARENNTEFVYTEIAKEAFVFFVHNKNVERNIGLYFINFDLYIFGFYSIFHNKKNKSKSIYCFNCNESFIFFTCISFFKYVF